MTLMQTVLETEAFLSSAEDAGMSDEEREVVVTLLAIQPVKGVLLEGTGGCRKFRHKRPGAGKSGGYRVVTYFCGVDLPVVLLAVFGKNEKDNLTKAERNDLKKLTAILEASLRKKT